MGEHDRQGASAASFSEPGQCLLLLRSPNDREIYEAFRALARQTNRGCKEHLAVEGDLSLTAGLSAAEIPATVKRLLDADAEMIDRLELEFGGLRWTYVRSGGHPPFRESFFDEVHIQQVDALSFTDEQLQDLVRHVASQLPIASHTGDGALCELMSEALEQARRRQVTDGGRGEKHL